MTILRRLWRRLWWRSAPPPIDDDLERAYRRLRLLVRAYDGAVDAQIRRDFEEFSKEIEYARSMQRERRRQS